MGMYGSNQACMQVSSSFTSAASMCTPRPSASWPPPRSVRAARGSPAAGSAASFIYRDQQPGRRGVTDLDRWRVYAVLDRWRVYAVFRERLYNGRKKFTELQRDIVTHSGIRRAYCFKGSCSSHSTRIPSCQHSWVWISHLVHTR